MTGNERAERGNKRGCESRENREEEEEGRRLYKLRAGRHLVGLPPAPSVACQ